MIMREGPQRDPRSKIERLNLVSDSIEFFEERIEFVENELRYDKNDILIDHKLLDRIHQLEHQVDREKKIGQAIIDEGEG